MKRCIPCLAVLLLAACGSSGPLYLPGQDPHKAGLHKKEQRKNEATPAAPAQTPPAAAEQPAAPQPEAAPTPAPAADPGSNPPPAPPQP